jgi:phosphoribosylglycinamide formyltransferase 1
VSIVDIKRRVRANDEEQNLKLVFLTGGELRHHFMRKTIALSKGVEIVRSYCEGIEKSLARLVEREGKDSDTRLQHLASREQSEQDFFGIFAARVPERSAPVFIAKGEINQDIHARDIASLEPDLLAAYGCSLIRDPLLSMFKGRFLNVHLGLSPYYRGSGTNFWPLVQGRPEFVGATFMHIDAGVDTGEIIHQIRAVVFPGDTPHQIGNRLIRDVALVYADIIAKFRSLPPMPQLPIPNEVSVYRIKDFTEESVRTLYRQFAGGMIERYLKDFNGRTAAVPIIENPAIKPVASLMQSIQ